MQKFKLTAVFQKTCISQRMGQLLTSPYIELARNRTLCFYLHFSHPNIVHFKEITRSYSKT